MQQIYFIITENKAKYNKNEQRHCNVDRKHQPAERQQRMQAVFANGISHGAKGTNRCKHHYKMQGPKTYLEITDNG